MKQAFLLSLALLPAASDLRAEDTTRISAAQKDSHGYLVHDVESPYQAKTTLIRVLLPEKREEGKKYRVVYVLPVEAGRESKYGDGLEEVKTLGLHNKHSLIFVAPTFAHLPWYADHPSKPEIRQESHFVKVVVAFVDKTYPVQGAAEGRWLLGFSKSGWGAYSLLLRHPDLFGKAAAWDAPLMMDKPGKYGSGDIFATSANFEHYRVSKLLEQEAAGLRKTPRLLLLGYGNFRGDHDSAHALMEKLEILHTLRDGPARKHDWHSGWVAEAVDLLVQKAGAK